jgi:hypothetical protein
MCLASSASICVIRIMYVDKDYMLVDGDGVVKSTNGTWLFAEKEIALENCSELMVGQSLFRIDIYI